MARKQRRLTAAEAAERLEVTVEHVRALARDRRIGQKVGGRWEFTSAEIREYKKYFQRRDLRTGKLIKPKKRKKRAAPRSNRLTAADMAVLRQLDQMLALERTMEARFQLPFRFPHQVASTISACPRCGHEVVFLIFGDNAHDEAGLWGYVRMMEAVIRQKNMVTYVINPPDTTTTDDPDAQPSLLLRVWPSAAPLRTVTRATWDAVVAAECTVCGEPQGDAND